MANFENVMDRALEGVKIANFTHAMAGAFSAFFLASFGATVIKIESRTLLDWVRQSAPFIDNIQTPDRAVHYLSSNGGGQYGITLNFKSLRGKEIAKKIIQWSDVVMENFKGGTMAKAGLGYEDLKKIKPDIIMLSGSIYGETGPFSSLRGYGTTLTALTGFPHLTGFPDEPPQFPTQAFTDFISPRIMVLAIVAALEYRRATGKGQYIDAAQMEAAIPLLTPILLEYEVNGNEVERTGNRSAYMAPHGVYPCKGEDRWCTITVSGDEEWQRFCKVIGNLAWTSDPKFLTVLSRIKNVDELDTFVAEWTIKHTPEEVMRLMQDAGVAAGVVQTGRELATDPQLSSRHFFWEVDLPEVGNFPYNGLPATLSKTPYEIKRAPMLGEHNEYVYTQLLGISDEEFVQLDAEGVFE